MDINMVLAYVPDFDDLPAAVELTQARDDEAAANLLASIGVELAQARDDEAAANLLASIGEEDDYA